MSGKNLTTPANTQWTIIKLLQWAASYLKSHDIDSPRATGEILLAHALKLERIELYLNYDQPLLADELKAFKSLIQRRIGREPVAYILGRKEFWSLDLEVTRDVGGIVEVSISTSKANSGSGHGLRGDHACIGVTTTSAHLFCFRFECPGA